MPKESGIRRVQERLPVDSLIGSTADQHLLSLKAEAVHIDVLGSNIPCFQFLGVVFFTYLHKGMGARFVKIFFLVRLQGLEFKDNAPITRLFWEQADIIASIATFPV